MKFRSLIAVAVIGLIGLASVLVTPSRAQSTPATLPAGVTKTIDTVTQVAGNVIPAVSGAVQGIQTAQQSGDPAAVIQATGAAISQVTAAAAAIPSPASGYLSLASLISAIATPLIVGIFGLFMHKSNQAAHATAQAAVSSSA